MQEELATNPPVITMQTRFDSCSLVQDIQNQSYAFPSSGVFWDIENTHSQATIRKFAQIGIIDGFPDGSFGPDKEITRAEFLKIVLISHCYDYIRADTTLLPYRDVDKSSWQARVITKAENL